MSLPEGPKPLLSFCNWSGLAGVVAGSLTEDVHYDPSHNVLRLRQHQRATFRDADPVLSMIRAHTQIDEDSEDSLRTCIVEVIQNAQDHSQSAVGAVSSARYLAQSDEVRVAIVDRGLGIEQTLRKRYPSVNSYNALRWVAEGNYTAQSRQNNAGQGIRLLKDIIRARGGSLFIISGESGFEIRTQPVIRHTFVELGFRFGGTGVFFSFPMKEANS